MMMPSGPTHRTHRTSLAISIPPPPPVPHAPKYGFTDSSVALTTSFTSAQSLHKNQLIILKNRPCRILSIASSPEVDGTPTTATPVTPTICIDSIDEVKPKKKTKRPVCI